MRKLLRQINVIILSFVLIFAPTYVLATTVAADGWSVSKRLVQGATTFYDGTKNIVINGKNYAATGAAAITPAAGQVAKMIVRTGAVVAVDLAIKTLIGAVDYVMDPANNQVKYYVEPTSQTPKPTDLYMWKYLDSANVAHNYAYPGVPSSLCQSFLSLWTGKTPWKYDRVSVSSSSATQVVCYFSSSTTTYAGNSGATRVNNPAYDPNAQPNREERYLPYDAVASQIISDAAAEKADGKAYVSSVADTALDNDEQKQIVPASDVTQQLNNSQAIPTNGTGTGTATPATTGTGTGDPTTAQPTPYDIKLNFPVFCDWAPSICVAAQTVINFPAKVDKWIEGLFYNTKGLPDYDTKTDLYINEQPEVKHVNINWGSVCPAPITVNLGFKGISREITVVNYQYICDYAWIIKASVNMLASISAVYIVAGRKE